MTQLTGWFRDGCCNTDKNDHGVHTVCAKVTNEFLEWCKKDGNDLITPHPEFGFSGLKDGDNWCVCASRSCCKVFRGWKSMLCVFKKNSRKYFKIYLYRTIKKTRNRSLS